METVYGVDDRVKASKTPEKPSSIDIALLDQWSSQTFYDSVFAREDMFHFIAEEGKLTLIEQCVDSSHSI
jgi:hypothetical protein